MDTDPNAYNDRGPSSTSSTIPHQRPAASHSSSTSSELVGLRDHRKHASPNMGSSNGMMPNPMVPQQSSPKLSRSPTLQQSPSIPPHAESSQQAARRNAATQLESDMFTPFVSPAHPAHTPAGSRGATNPPPSAEHLRQMIGQEADSQPIAHDEPVNPPEEVVQQSLLTCKPLDRVSVQPPEHLPPAPSTAAWAQARKQPMERIVSQAGPPPPYRPRPPMLKRARSFSDPPENHRPSALFQARSAAKYFRGMPRKRMRVWTAKDAAEAHEGERLMRQIRGRAQDHYIAAAREPPVNMRSLRVLDTNEVLRLPQMRHDLLFDNFGFRPIHSPMPYHSTNYGLLSTNMRSQIVHPSPASEAANKYWECIRREIELGCRCTRWDHSQPGRIKDCICGNWKAGLNEKQWWKETRATWPSRLPKLISTLREILESLMASTTTCVNHYAHPNKEAQALHAQSCPTVTHSLVPTLFAALDAEFLTIQVRRGNFDTGIFNVIGEAMKIHCAPVRDAMVNDMVATATGAGGKRKPNVVQGLRKCFDCVEVMKLDIANHQVQSLKGMLWQQAEQNEMTTFINYLIAAGRTLETSKTYAWINAASKRVAMSTSPRERRHLLAQCGCGSNTEFVIRSLTEGFVQLVFGDWIECNEPWPPALPSRRPVGVPINAPVFPSKVVVPEVFKMDSFRLKLYHTELVDLTIATTILQTFQEAYVAHNASDTAEQVRAQVTQVHDSYKHIMTMGNGLLRPSSDCPSDLALHMAHRIVFSKTTENYNTERSHSDVELVNALAHDFDTFIMRDLASFSCARFAETFGKVRKLATTMLANTLLLHRVQPESVLYDTAGADARPCANPGPKVKAPRLRVASRRFVTLAEPLRGQGSSTSDPRERYHRPASAEITAARELFRSTQADNREAEDALASELGLEHVLSDIRAVVEKMAKTADFNLSVFAPLYGRGGMLIGSGAVIPLPELERECRY